MHKLVILLLTLEPILCAKDEFPADFLFGIASSAYQIEGGHDANGKGASIWDHYLRLNPALVRDSTNGDTACDSYNKYEEDVSLLADLGVDFYRFSISWSRILPTGYSNKINPDGVRYYNELIDGLVARNIRPMVAMYHWDLPKPLQDLGGWTNPLLSDLFEDYAKILFENFGDRVKLWITVNTNWMGYGDAQFPPLLNQSGIGEYLYVKNVLLAHAKVYHLYNREFRSSQNGQIGITVDGRWYEPATPRDQEAAERTRQFYIGTVANPIFGDGDFPKLVKERVDELSQEEGFSRSRLPKFSREEVEYVKGTYDFFGINIYTTFLTKDVEIEDGSEPSFGKDLKAELHHDPKWPESNSFWLKVVPWGCRRVLNWIKESYGNPPIFITENGFSDRGELDDVDRIDYFESYLNAVLEAIHEDGVQVRGYAAWSLLDNFEWTSGYSERFGLHHVDFADPGRRRTAKSSARWYKDVIERRRLDAPSDTLKTEL
ncbi:myrosinase 1-like [Asbolus verrucosus]|uniref:beta-glucosidase n=1 Tax=Asbolus verrucosus TaxID=1661398 RepID=A0A482V7G5_ASBVE|nr:myrosinase 1-like [Asbolus verrucosus]